MTLSTTLGALLQAHAAVTVKSRPMTEATAADLVERFKAYRIPHVFEPGDLVQYKPGLGLADRDEFDVMIVIEGGPELREKMEPSILVANIDGDGDFMFGYAAVHRLEPYGGPR